MRNEIECKMVWENYQEVKAYRKGWVWDVRDEIEKDLRDNSKYTIHTLSITEKADYIAAIVIFQRNKS